MAKVLYAIPTRLCNLSCPHCDIVGIKDDYNETEFLKALEKERESADFIIAFGGEPTLFPDRLDKMAPCIDSISTNGLNVESILPYKDKLNIATSWNKDRFTNEEFKTWKENVKKLAPNKPLLLITLTPDLIADKNFAAFAEKHFAGLFSSIQFEQLHDDTKDQSYYDEVDKWLCDLYDNWNHDLLYCTTFDEKIPWIMDCTETYTLEPSGKVTYGCPQYETKIIRSECLSCEYAEECQPCVLQKNCTRPKLLLNKLNKTLRNA